MNANRQIQKNMKYSYKDKSSCRLH